MKFSSNIYTVLLAVSPIEVRIEQTWSEFGRFFSKVVRKRSELTTKSPNLWMKITCKSSLHVKTCYIEGKLIVYDPISDFVIRPTCSYIFDLGEAKKQIPEFQCPDDDMNQIVRVQEKMMKLFA